MKLFKQNNWMHILGLICFSYILLYWGSSDYAKTTNLFPTIAVRELFLLPIFIQICFHTFFSIVLTIVVNLIELYFLKVGFDWFEFIVGIIGTLLGFGLWFLLPENQAVFIICIVVILAFVTYIINSLIISHE